MRDIISTIQLFRNHPMNHVASFLALNRMPGIGPRTVMSLLLRWPRLADLFQLSCADLIESGLSVKLAQAISSFDHRQVEPDLLWQSKPGQTILTWDDPRYPALLREIHDPPFVLYVRGSLEALEQKTVSMVGSRQPSIMGEEIAFSFAADFARHQLAVVSGLALGIDACSHRGCLSQDGVTIAVMATGIDRIYPAAHRDLAEKICKKGVLLSEFPLNTPPMSGHFPRRNRIISGLSSSTLVVEAAIRSGSLITARYAVEQNRDVLAVPGSIHHDLAKGCHYLLQQGACLVGSSRDVLDALGVAHQDVGVTHSRTLARRNENLVQCIGFETTTIDQVVYRSGLSLNEILSKLSELEMLGDIQAVPGGYMRCR